MKIRCLLASAILSSAVFGHHAWQGLVDFDTSKTVKISGTISKVEFSNPHALIYIDVKNPNGTVTTWTVEAPPPNTLVRRGITKDRLAAGTTITVDTYTAKDGSPKANSNSLSLGDGQELLVRNTAPAK